MIDSVEHFIYVKKPQLKIRYDRQLQRWQRRQE